MTTTQTKAAPGIGWYRSRDFDEVAVLRATWGDRLKLTKAERDAAIDELDRRGLSAAEIAHRIGCSQRTVCRRRVARMTAGGPAPTISFRLSHGDRVWERIAELDAAGLSGPQIAQRAGVSVSTVYYHRAKRAQSGRVAA